MACEFEVLLNQHQYSQGTELAVQALDLVQQIENLLSIYKPRSDLSNLNRFGAQRAVGISPDTVVLLVRHHDTAVRRHGHVLWKAEERLVGRGEAMSREWHLKRDRRFRKQLGGSLGRTS